MIAQMVRERFDNFLIGKLKQAWPLFDERDAHSEGGEHACVLDADDAATDNDQRFGEVLHLQHLVAVDNRLPIDLDL